MFLAFILILIITGIILSFVFHSKITQTNKSSNIFSSSYSINSLYTYHKDSSICLSTSFNENTREACSQTISDHSFIILEAGDIPILPKDIKYVNAKYILIKEAEAKAKAYAETKKYENTNSEENILSSSNIQSKNKFY